MTSLSLNSTFSPSGLQDRGYQIAHFAVSLFKMATHEKGLPLSVPYQGNPLFDILVEHL